MQEGGLPVRAARSRILASWQRLSVCNTCYIEQSDDLATDCRERDVEIDWARDVLEEPTQRHTL